MRKVFKYILITVGVLVCLILLVVLFYTAPLWYKHFVTYPRLEKERAKIWQDHKSPPKRIPLNEYRGILHAHTYWSHDSRGQIEEILPAAKKAGLDFLFFSDHPHAQLDSFPRSYYGNYDGILIEPGSEKSGLMVCPMDSVVLDWGEGSDAVIHDVVSRGGLALYVHTEKEHDWDNPDYQGMEIYNIHTDLMDEDNIFKLILNFAVNGKKYRHWAFREIFDEQTAILARWDSLNTIRRIVGFGAPDAHNNQNIRARYLEDGRVEWVGPDANTISIRKPGLLEKLLLHEPDEAGWAFRFETDTYYGSFHFVNTHVFSETLTIRAIKNNLVKGHAFVSFASLADASGFQFFTVDQSDNLTAIMGDSVAIGSVETLVALSPLPVQFEVVKDGSVVQSTEGSYDIQLKPLTIGNYRVVASLKLSDQWIPWVYTNPIYVH